MSAKLYTQEQLDIELLKKESSVTSQTLNRIENELIAIDKKTDSNFLWLITFMISGFVGTLGLMAHGFKWF